MYGLAEVKEAIENPHVALREFNRLYYRRFFLRPYNTAGHDIFEADWDTLIILDACRYDTFEAHADLPGTLFKRISRGAATPEFIRANFSGRQFPETIYVSHNTWFLKLREKIDSKVFDFRLTTDQSPTETTETALSAIEEHPNKRLIVHYVPPHHPFVGPTAEEIFPDYEAQSSDLFEQIQRGDLKITDEQLQQTYVENLNRVLPEVERLLDKLDGRTVVTADHGELLGDISSPVAIKDYGHHVGLYVDELVEVPWLVSESGERRKIVSGAISEGTGVAKETVDQRLRDLGYKI
jgi:hypothetical protein